MTSAIPPAQEAHPFVFQKSLFLVELTGRRVHTLEEFADALEDLEDMTLFCHLVLPLMGHHLIPPEYDDDFSYWVGGILREKPLAERMMALVEDRLTDLASFRHDLGSVIREHIASHPTAGSLRDDLGFFFNRVDIVVYPTGYQAATLAEFTDLLGDIDVNSMFYHFHVSQLLFSAGSNDFSRWLSAELGENELAERINTLDPFGYDNLEQLRDDILAIITRP